MSVTEVSARDAILGYVRSYPGIHFRALARNLGLGSGTLNYHTHILAENKLITMLRFRKNKHLFPVGIGLFDQRCLALVRSTSTRALIEVLLSQKDGLTNKELSHKTRLAPSTISWHMQRLLKDGFVHQTNEKYSLCEAEHLRKIVAGYEDAPIDRLVTNFTRLWS